MLASSILPILALYAHAFVSSEATDWPMAMGYSKISKQSAYVKRLSALLDHSAISVAGKVSQPRSLAPASTEPGHTNSITGTGNRLSAEQLARLNAFGQVINDTCVQAKKVAANGDVSGARANLETFLMAYPLPMPAYTLMDLEIREGDYIDAYKVAAPFMSHGTGSVELKVRASLAAAKLGEVYPGQREFCRQIIGYGAWAAYLPSGESPEVMAELSDLAIVGQLGGDRASSFAYLEDAYKIDPQNPWICRMLSDCYVDSNWNYSAAAKLLETALKGVPSGILHDDVLNALTDARVNYRKVGDGNPPSPRGRPTPKPSTGPIKP